MKTELNRMGRIRLFPLLFQNGCSQSSRFVPQARRIVGSGDENAKINKHSAADPNACALCYCLGYSRPFVRDTSSKLIDREGLGESRTGTRQSLPYKNKQIRELQKRGVLDLTSHPALDPCPVKLGRERKWRHFDVL